MAFAPDPICIICNKYVIYNTIIKCSSCGSMSIHDNCYKKHYKKQNKKQQCLTCVGSITGPPEPAKVAAAAGSSSEPAKVAAAGSSSEPAKDDESDDSFVEMLILLCIGAGAGAAGQTL
jgi:hypothetical protein